MIDELLLVGNIHVDFKGNTRLMSILDAYEPDVISLEVSTDDLINFDYYKERSIAKLKTELTDLGANSIFFETSILYEIDAIKKYALEHDVLIHAISKNILEDREKDILGSISENLAFVNRHNGDIGLAQARIDEYYQNSDEFPDPLSLPAYHMRDKYMELSIRECHGRVLHISSLMQVFGNYANLYNQLEDLHPIRIKLAEVELGLNNFN